jgi:hypothetical protein
LKVEALAAQINLPLSVDKIRRFLFDQLYPNAPLSGDEVDIGICPIFNSSIHVFHSAESALATFYAPSDTSGIGGMHRQHIRAAPSWRHSEARYDCMFLEKDPTLAGFRGLHAVQVCLFFRSSTNGKHFPVRLCSGSHQLTMNHAKIQVCGSWPLIGTGLDSV